MNNILYEETKTEQVAWLISNMISYVYYCNKNYDDKEHRFSEVEFEKMMSALRYSLPDIGRRDCDVLRGVLHTTLHEWEKYIAYNEKSGKQAAVVVKENIDWHLKEGL